MEFHDLFVLLLVSELPTVRQFLLRQTQLKCVMFGNLHYDSDTNMDSDTDAVDKDMDMNVKDTKTNQIDTVKVLKCYSGIAT